MLFISSLSSSASAARVRTAFRTVLVALVPMTTACAAAADEQGGAQFPPIGAAGIPAQQAAPFPAAPVEEDQSAQPEDGAWNDTAIMGDDDAPAPMAPPVDDEYADTDPSALTDFHAALDPYGQWVEDPSYGTIWQPSAAAVGGDFAPYETAGHWAYGDDYTWVSDYSWGWAPFHYGRWVYATNGWGWIPGRQYAGAWTTWRRGYGAAAGYVGWAPLPPTYTWRGGAAYGIGVVPPAPYAFCSTSNLFAPSLAGRMVTGPQVGAIGPSTRPVGAVMGRGPGVVGSVAGARGGSGAFAGRTVAHPEVSGPTPQSMNIAQSNVTRPPSSNSGLNRATQYAHPSTATALGARAPSTGFAASASASSGGARGAGQGRVGGGAVGGGARPYASSMGTSAYGRYNGGFHGQTRTIGGGGYGGSHAGYRGYHGGVPYYGHAGQPGFHGMGPHGVPVAAPAAKHPVDDYGGGYHPHGGRGGGRGGRGGGRR